MSAASFLAEIRDTVVPDRAGRHGPLPPLLVSMTVVTGLVEAFSCLVLGVAMLAGALLGAALIRDARPYDALAIALAVDRTGRRGELPDRTNQSGLGSPAGSEIAPVVELG